MKVFSFLVNDEFYAVDVALVQRVVQKMTVTPVPSAPDEVIGIANLKGRVITVLNLCVLLGDKKKHDIEYGSRAVKAIIFKTFSGSEEQFGLLIDKPGSLVEINDNTIRPLSRTGETDEGFCISGIAEINNVLLRIINIDSIISKFKLNGGIENEKYI